MANIHRGEVGALIDGVPRILCLTLGALAELEAAFGAGDLVALAQRFESGRLASRDILLLIACGLRGGGTAVTDADVAAMHFPGGLREAIQIAVDLVAATFGTNAREDRSPDPPGSSPNPMGSSPNPPAPHDD